MARVGLTLEALRDLNRIIAELGILAGAAVAEKFDRKFASLFLRLGEHPESGFLRGNRRRNMRIAMNDPFVVYYQFNRQNDVVTIVRVRHGRQKPLEQN